MVSTTGAKDIVIPCYGADAPIMTSHGLNHFVLDCVPNLELSGVSANSEKVAISWPLHARYSILWANVAQLINCTALGRPEVYAGAEANCQNILRWPIDQVKVEIIL